MDSDMKKLILWVAQNGFAEVTPESMFGGPKSWVVSCEGLLDTISEIWLLPKRDISDVFNPERERIEKQDA